MENEEGVFSLVTKLCTRTASKYAGPNKVSQKYLAAKMRSTAYEIILKKSAEEVQCSKGEPIIDLLSYYLMSHKNAKNVAEYKRSVDLKKIIAKIRQSDFGDNKDNIYSVLELLVGLSDSVKEDFSPELFQNPFSFGMLDEMLPKPSREVFGSPVPYSYYPSYVFQLPFSLKQEPAVKTPSRTYTEYTIESFQSKSFLPEVSCSDRVEIQSFISPMSMPSLLSTHVSSPYSQSTVNFPRLTAPRDLKIPDYNNVKLTLLSESENEVQEVFRANNTVDIWEAATQLDKDLPDDIWDVASKMPAIQERQLIATSSREMALWRRIYGNTLQDLSVISEKQFIRNIMYLIIGIETKCFPFCEDSNCFYMKEDLVLEGISKEHIKGYVTDLLLVGTYYRRLFKFAFNQSLEEHFHSKGLIYEAAREVIRRYLLEFRLKATSLYEENNNEDLNCIPTLLQILYHIESLKYEIETIVSIYKLIDLELNVTIPLGVELMSYLFNEISMITHKKTAHTMFNSLFSICRVYFKFIERFIFEGELDDCYNEFFIRKDSAYVNTRSKRYWDKGFHITQSQAVPEFLRPLAKYILLCGKSLRLLKHCNPSDPLVLLISSDHPSVTCCASFAELERQQQMLDVYRTRCLFVSGEPATFDQILLKQEAERKAFTEMASVKQAETMEKIVAERKRLAQLIIAEKQHSLRVLEQAMAEAAAARQNAKQRERHRYRLQREAERARDEVDAKLRDDERNKMMEYYSKLNQEVEKSKMHTEWKIRRLQLDETRMQLLSTEERNLKREKLELEHKRNEHVMVTSSSSSFQSADDQSSNNKDKESQEARDKVSQLTISSTDVNKPKARSTDVLSAICNAAKTLFGVSKSDSAVDNIKELDAQGNIVPVDTENNTAKYTQSSDVIGADLNNTLDNQEYLHMREKASKNKQRVMENSGLDKDNNQVGSIDGENNIQKFLEPFIEAKRNKLKVLGVEFAKTSEARPHTPTQPLTEAQREAHANKLKILGVEYNLPVKIVPKNDPANVAQEEALRNKEKILGSESSMGNSSTPVEPPIKNEPANVAQEEAIRNKEKILGSEGSMGPSTQTENYQKEPANTAQKEALRNKEKILGSENSRSDPKMPIEIAHRKEPVNFAQEEALQNRNKILGSDNMKQQCDPQKRSGLTLNLKPCNEFSSTSRSGGGLLTPADFLSTLDLETPTTGDIPLEGIPTSDVFTPHSETNRLETADIHSDKPFLTSDGFDFSLLIEDAVDAEVAGLMKDSPESSPSKYTHTFGQRRSMINYFDDSYCFEDFDPFGVRDLKSYSKDHFTSRMDISSSNSVYTHPAVIMEEVKKKPYYNMFSRLSPDNDDEKKVNSDNIATLTACLQKSVMLPLTYQLEVVNNSILTYFLVNLDMYEHLRSLKDYFFLMDGEFSKSICQNLFARLVKTLNPQDLLNFATLHNILDKALGSSISHVHKFSENLSFTIMESPLSFQHSSPDVLQCLSLTYAVGWPLNIILSQEALLRYARVFQFLLKMRRIFWVLGEDFQYLKLSAKLSREHSRKLIKSPQYISIQIYRHIMASMIRALDNYIVTTCILSSWKEFENDLKKARTLDDLYDCHVAYIKKVLFRCLLNNRSTPVMKLLNDVFTVILKFSRVLKHGEWQQKDPNGYFTHSCFQQLQELFHLFEKLAKYLHKVITKLMECGYQRHLAELLSMFNLNGYYDLNSSKTRDEQNISMQSP